MLVVHPLAHAFGSGALLEELHSATDGELAVGMLDVELQHGVLAAEGVKDDGVAGTDLAVAAMVRRVFMTEFLILGVSRNLTQIAGFS